MKKYTISLEKLVAKLRKLHGVDSQSEDYVATKKNVVERLKKKILRLNDKLLKNCQIEPWHLYLSQNEENFYSLSQVIDFNVLFRRDINIIYHYKKKNYQAVKNVIFTKKDGESIECCKDDYKITIPSLNSKEIQSWTRLKYLSEDVYKKHWYEKNYRGKESKFLKDIKIGELERNIFQNGFGHFGRNGDEIFLYGKLDRPVGSININGKTQKTKYIKVQLNRVLRPLRKVNIDGKSKTRRDGYMTEIHGYPISYNELCADFPVGAGLVNKHVIIN